MAGYVIVNEELDKFDLNEELNKSDLNINNLFGIIPVFNFIIDKYKQILLIILAIVIIYVVDYLTYYNNLFYGMAPSVPGVNQQQQQPNQIKSNSFKRKSRKFKK